VEALWHKESTFQVRKWEKTTGMTVLGGLPAYLDLALDLWQSRQIDWMDVSLRRSSRR
jgi:hypothetical protein